MSPIRRRRPLLRTAVIGGGAYMAGKASGRRSGGQAGSESARQVRPAGPEPGQRAAGSAAPAPEPESEGSALLDQLSKLTEMHERGSLTDEEFTAAKTRLLG